MSCTIQQLNWTTMSYSYSSSSGPQCPIHIGAELDHVLFLQQLTWTTIFYSYNRWPGPPYSSHTTADLDHHVMYYTTAELDYNVLFILEPNWTTVFYSYNSRPGPPCSIHTTADLDHHVLFIQQQTWTTMWCTIQQLNWTTTATKLLRKRHFPRTTRLHHCRTPCLSTACHGWHPSYVKMKSAPTDN